MFKTRLFTDSFIMFKRNLTKTMRSPQSMVMAIIVPVVMMILFGYVFGGIANVGELSYINFIVPGIIVQCVTNASSATAISLHNDMNKGIIDRFRSMAIAKSAVISGHVWLSVIRSMVITAITIGAAFVMGFRPNAGFSDWLMISAILTLFIVAVTWVAVVIGLLSADAESISGGMFLLTILTFLSSAFTPTYALPNVLRVFAQHQPMTPVIDAVRSLMLGVPANGAFLTAFLWCLGITLLAFVASVHIYKSKLTR